MHDLPQFVDFSFILISIFFQLQAGRASFQVEISLVIWASFKCQRPIAGQLSLNENNRSTNHFLCVWIASTFVVSFYLEAFFLKELAKTVWSYNRYIWSWKILMANPNSWVFVASSDCSVCGTDWFYGTPFPVRWSPGRQNETLRSYRKPEWSTQPRRNSFDQFTLGTWQSKDLN